MKPWFPGNSGKLRARFGAASAGMWVAVKRELSRKVKLNQLIYVTTLTCDYQLPVTTERLRSQIQAAEISFLRRVSGLSVLLDSAGNISVISGVQLGFETSCKSFVWRLVRQQAHSFLWSTTGTTGFDVMTKKKKKRKKKKTLFIGIQQWRLRYIRTGEYFIDRSAKNVTEGFSWWKVCLHHPHDWLSPNELIVCRVQVSVLFQTRTTFQMSLCKNHLLCEVNWKLSKSFSKLT